MSQVPEVRVMADFGANPLWTVAADGSITNPASTELVTAELARRLDAWAARYDATYVADYPPDSAFADASDERIFVEDGRQLAHEVAATLSGRGIRVRYATGAGYEEVPGERHANPATDYQVDPEVAGGFGDNIEIDHSTTPLTVTRMHYEIETWLGSELLTSHPIYVATERFVEVVAAAGLTGYETAPAEVTVSDQGREYLVEYRGFTGLPPFVWFRPVGRRGHDDFALDDRANLFVSARALDVILPLLGEDVYVTETPTG